MSHRVVDDATTTRTWSDSGFFQNECVSAATRLLLGHPSADATAWLDQIIGAVSTRAAPWLDGSESNGSDPAGPDRVEAVGHGHTFSNDAPVGLPLRTHAVGAAWTTPGIGGHGKHKSALLIQLTDPETRPIRAVPTFKQVSRYLFNLPHNHGKCTCVDVYMMHPRKAATAQTGTPN